MRTSLFNYLFFLIFKNIYIACIKEKHMVKKGRVTHIYIYIYNSCMTLFIFYIKKKGCITIRLLTSGDKCEWSKKKGD